MTPPSQPHKFGPYEVVGPLGKGGMARVFEVRHPELPERRLALKLVAPARLEDRALKRFEREAQLLARVRHAGLVTVHAYGRSPHGPWLVMDLIEGAALDATIAARGAFPPRDAASIVADVAEAVAALHAHGILHRDVKPENVVLRPDGRPVLLDLGVARADDSARLTETGTLVGSPQYMAPEQADGTRPADLTPAVDVYGLGGLLFALLTGRPPVADAPSLLEVVRQVVEGQPVWPSEERPGTPAPLEAILRRAMSRRPADRQPGAAALADELRTWLRESAPSRVAPPPPPRVSRRRGALVAAGALAGLGLVALLVWWSGPPRAPPLVDGPAVAPPRTAAPADPTPAPERPGPLQVLHPGAERDPVGARWLPRGRALTWTGPPELGAPRPSTRVLLWSLAPPAPARREREWEVPGAVGVLRLDASGVAWLVVVGPTGRGLYRLDPLRDRAAEPVPLDERRGAITALAVDPAGSRLALAYQEPDAAAEVVVLDLTPQAPRQVASLSLPEDARISDLLLPETGRLLVAGGGVPPHRPGQREQLGHGGISAWRLPPAVEAPERVGLTGSTNQALALALDPEGRLWAGNSYGFLGQADLRSGTLETLTGAGMDEPLPGLDPLLARLPSHRGPVVEIVPAPSPARWLLARWAHRPRWLWSASTLVARSEGERRVERAHEVRAWRSAPGGEWVNTGGLLDWPAPITTLDVTADGEWLLVGTRARAEVWPAARLREGFYAWRDLGE